MPPQRLTALWRSTGRLALRPQPTLWTKLPTMAATEAQPRLLIRTARGAVFPVRGYADDRTPKTDSESAEASRQALIDAAAAAMGFAEAEVKTPATEAEATEAEATEAAAATEATEATVATEAVEAAEVVAAAAEAVPTETTPENLEALRQLELLSQGLAPFDAQADGHKFGLTTATTRPAAAEDGADADQRLPQVGKLQDRYDPVIAQLTRLLMRDGKLAKAQRDMAMVLNYLQTSPAPKLSPARPLLPGHPPAAQLPLDPVRYMTLAIDSVAPLIKIRSYAGQAGGGAALQVPVPLAARQRRRTVFMWLLDIVNKKPSRGSGRTMLAHRIGEEVVAIVEGRSSLWEKRQLLHKQGTSARVNVSKVHL